MPRPLRHSFVALTQPLLTGNDTLDCIRLCDMHRRGMILPSRAGMAGDIAGRLLKLTALTTYLDYNGDNAAQQKALDIDIALCLQDIKSRATLLAARKILLPFPADNKLLQGRLAVIIRRHKVGGLFLFRREGYAVDYTAFAITEKSADKNPLNDKRGQMVQMSNMWLIDDGLRRQWRQEKAPSRKPASRRAP